MKEAFLALQETIEFEEAGSLETVRVEREEEDLIVVLRLDTGNAGENQHWSLLKGGENDPVQYWELTCKGVKRALFTMETIGEASTFPQNDPVLWEFTHPQTSLWFYDRREDLIALVAAMKQAHILLLGGNLAGFDAGEFQERLAGGYGLLYKGVAPLAKAYEKALEKLGLRVSLTQEETPTETVEMIRLGNSYVIASTLTLRRRSLPQSKPDFEV